MSECIKISARYNLRRLSRFYTWIDPVNPIELQDSPDNDICLSFEQSLYSEIPESAFEKPDFDPEEFDDEAECDEPAAGSTMEADEESELVEACKALGNLQDKSYNSVKEVNLVDQLASQVKIPNKVSASGMSIPDDGAEILSSWPLDTLSEEEHNLGIVPFLDNGMEDLYFWRDTNKKDLSPLEFYEVKQNKYLAIAISFLWGWLPCKRTCKKYTTII